MATATQSKGLHYAWWISIAAFLTQFILIVGVQGAGVILSLLADSIGVTVAVAALVVSFFNIGQAVGAPIWGWILDKIASRKTFTLGCVLGSLSIMAFGLFSLNLILACIFSLLMGLTMASIRDATLPKLISTWFAPNMRGRGIIPMSLGGTVGGTLLGIVLPQLLNNFSWEISYVILGIFGLVISLIVFLVIRNDPADLGLLPCGLSAAEAAEAPAEAPAGEQQQTSGGMIAGFKMANAWILGIIYLLFQIYLVGNMNYIVTSVMDSGFDVAAAGLCVSIFSLTMCVSQIIFAALSDKIAIKYVLSIEFAGCFVGALLMVFLLGNADLLVVYVITAIMGLFMGVTPIVQTQSAELFPVPQRGVGAGAVGALGMIGGIVGPLIVAAVISAMGATEMYLWPCIICAALAFLISLFLLPKTGGKYGDPFLNADGTPKDLKDVVLKR